MKQTNRICGGVGFFRSIFPVVMMVLMAASPLWARKDRAALIHALQSHIRYLASDSLEGRGAGSEGNWKAARYIADFFRHNGVRPVEESYFQEFEVITGVELGEKNQAVVQRGEERWEWKVQEDFIPLSFSVDTALTAGVVFAGYGITNEDSTYDDYAGLNVEGKIVIVFRASPDYENPHGRFAEYASLFYKVHNAREHGAAGIIYVSPTDLQDELISLNRNLGAPGHTFGLVAVHARRATLEKLLPPEMSLDSLESAIKKELKPHSFELSGVQMTLETSLKFIHKPTANVIGLVRGSDPALAEEYIVVGAHFDHLGWGDRGGSRYTGSEPAIHHGADDNASGTTAMMTLAARIARNPLPRSVLFIGFSGEEMGLLGSAYYCEHPLIPLENTVMMLNMDMVGRMQENKLMVTGTGTSSHWEPLVDSLGEAFHLKISKTADGYGPTDHSSFYARNIPVLNLFTGLHDDYHRPSDTWDKINYEGMATIIDFAGAILQEVGRMPKRPDFVKVTGSSRQGERTRFRVWVGTVPDYSDHPKGMRITGVREGSPAEKAGLQAGDVIVKFGDTEVKNIYDYTYALGKYKPGDVVEVVVLRGEGDAEERITLKVTLEARK